MPPWGWTANPLLVGSVVLLVVTATCYLPVLRAGFIWDDDKMLTNNPFVRLPLGFYYIWCSTVLPDYYPLTSTSFWLEWRLWGMNATGYHITNVLLHGTSACLLWRVLKALRIPGAWLAALVFAVHPVNVQSVAWIAERKNTLCLFFSLLSVLWYLRSESEGAGNGRPETGDGRPEVEDAGQRPEGRGQNSSLRTSHFLLPASKWYWLSLIAFACALLSKTAVVMLPFVLLVCHWWLSRVGGASARANCPAAGSMDQGVSRSPAESINHQLSPASYQLLLRLTPFFALSLLLGLVTMWFQSHRAIGGDIIRNDDFLTRLATVGRAVWFYAAKTLAPVDLCFVYPLWKTDSHAVVSWLPLAAVPLALAVFWTFQRCWGRSLLFAFGYFLLMLLPILGLVNVYFQRYSLVADHWTYFASLGIMVLAVRTGAHLFKRFKKEGGWLLPVAAVAAVVWLGAATWRQAGIYHDLGTLWEDTLAKNPSCWLAHNSLGSALADVGRLDEARAHYEQGLTIKPDSAELLNNLASVLLDQGRPAEAISYLHKTLEVAPRSAMAYYNLGNAFDQLNKPHEAEANYRRALELDPNHAECHSNLACLLYAAGKPQEALEEFTRAISLKPDYAEALNNLGAIFLEQGRAQEAESLLRDAVRYKPAYTDAHFNLGNALLSEGAAREAASSYRRALQLKPDWPEALAGLGFTLATAPGEQDREVVEALRVATRAVELTQHTNFVALDALAAACAATGQYDEAARTAAKAAELAQAAGDKKREDQIQSRRKLYEAGKPYRE